MAAPEKLTLILRSGLLAASRRMGHKRSRPSFETPRKRAAPQDEVEDAAPPGMTTRVRRDAGEGI
jgi:hypothetical protein